MLKLSLLSVFLFSLVSFCIFLPTNVVQANEQVSRPMLFSFQSYIDIVYDDEPLTEDLKLDKSTTIPLTIKYGTDVPSDFLKYMPWRLRNFILYGSMIAPQQTINISIIDKPDWMAISLSNNQFSVEIPAEENPIEISTSLILFPYSEAPAFPYTISIKVSCGQIGRINSFSTQISIVFTPEYKPDFILFPSSEKSYNISYNKNTQTFFEIQCLANKKSRVTPILKKAPENVTITFIPEYHDLNIGERDIFYVNISAKPSFKHNASIVLSANMQVFTLDQDRTLFESNETISYLLVPPKQNEEGYSFKINLILNIVLTVIIVILIVNFKWKKWW